MMQKEEPDDQKELNEAQSKDPKKAVAPAAKGGKTQAINEPVELTAEELEK